jgi:hypothetical protein
MKCPDLSIILTLRNALVAIRAHFSLKTPSPKPSGKNEMEKTACMLGGYAHIRYVARD